MPRSAKVAGLSIDHKREEECVTVAFVLGLETGYYGHDGCLDFVVWHVSLEIATTFEHDHWTHSDHQAIFLGSSSMTEPFWSVAGLINLAVLALSCAIVADV